MPALQRVISIILVICLTQLLVPTAAYAIDPSVPVTAFIYNQAGQLTAVYQFQNLAAAQQALVFAESAGNAVTIVPTSSLAAGAGGAGAAAGGTAAAGTTATATFGALTYFFLPVAVVILVGGTIVYVAYQNAQIGNLNAQYIQQSMAMGKTQQQAQAELDQWYQDVRNAQGSIPYQYWCRVTWGYGYGCK